MTLHRKLLRISHTYTKIKSPSNARHIKRFNHFAKSFLGKIFKIPSSQRNIRWYVNIESMLSELKIVLMENTISMEFVDCLLTISKDLFQKEEHGMERVTDEDNADTWTHSVLSWDLNICSEFIEAMWIKTPCFDK
ncbi:hypothetical protein CDAR_182011 [Caerostris darwini]|uniref:Uncharacterized protein n=1 Tax=Caerostris darwini TaxID=1538125 RepID=A0AAV4URZ6_9ARAC|nr:hypothetical protein CDAR_182011 [Caerostris darwini]